MTNYLIIKICLLFLSSLIFSILINRVFLKFSKNLGIRNIDDKVIRWSTTSKPSFGGISFFIVFLLVLSQYPIYFSAYDLPFDLQLIGIVAATSVGFLAGLTDDAYNTNPILKSLAQALCAIILIATGTCIEVFDSSFLNYALTFLWVVGLMNSINMLDNMDAITTVASIFAILSMLTVFFYQGNFSSVYFVLLIGMTGALLGFLFFNWHPSKMYMGDTGSQFLGVSLAALSVHFLWNFEGVAGNQVVSQQFILPLLAFLVPISDTTTVVINRIAAGKSPFVGGKDHTTHHLSYLGFSDTSVAFIVAGLGLISSVVLLVALAITSWDHMFTILFSVYAITVFLSLFLISRMNLSNNLGKHEPKERQIKKTA
ncbi:MAG: MraY family glycosyltransferase [Vicingaceae bacterium]